MRSLRGVAAALAAALALASGCGEERVTTALEARPVVVEPVTVRDLEERIEATGELQAKEEAAIASELAGRVTGILVEEGQPVEEGAVLLEIDPERRELEVADARAGLAEAAASLREQEREHVRMQTLRERNVASQARLDQVATELALARSRLDAAKARLGVAERTLRDATVRAPFTGWVARRHVSRGEYVQVGQVLFDLVALDPIEAEFHVAERDSARVAAGQQVEVQVAPYPEERFRGEVTLISPTIDPRTRTLRVEASIRNPDGRLRPGLFARVDLGVATRRGVFLVPEAAVLQRAEGEVVYRTLPDDRVERVAVETGVHRDGLVEVASGLGAGDRVVVRGQSGLVDGALVSPRGRDGRPLGTAVSAAEPEARTP